MSVAIIPDFVKYQIEWLTSHKDLEFEPVIEDAIVKMLQDTGKSFIDEQHAETSQTDHIAESDRKVSISCAHENDVIFRQAAIEAINGMIDRFERLLADIRESKVDDSVCGMCEYDGAYMGQSGDWCNECPGFDKDDCFKLSDRCRKRWMGDIVLPSAQPEHPKGHWIVWGGMDIPENHGKHKCSVCGEFAPVRYEKPLIKEYLSDFCPNCGADMRGEGEG